MGWRNRFVCGGVALSPETIRILQEEARKTVRMPSALVRITWAGNGIDNARAVVEQGKNRTSIEQQVTRAIGIQRRWGFCETTDQNAQRRATLDEVDGIYTMPDVPQEGTYAHGYLVGWWGGANAISTFGGAFRTPQVIRVEFPPIAISGFKLQGYLTNASPYHEYPVDFTVQAMRIDDGLHPIYYSDGVTLARVIVTGNNSVNYVGYFLESLPDVNVLRFSITRWSHVGSFVKITGAFDAFVREHKRDDILSLSILEETDGTVGTLPVGAVSCNECNLTLQNIDDQYFYGNTASALHNSARINRKIEPFIGFVKLDQHGNPEYDAVTGAQKVEYAPKGVYWSRDWDIADQSTGASTSALDRMGLLQKYEYNGIGDVDDAESYIWTNKSLHKIAEDVLLDLRLKYMDDLEFEISPALAAVIIPIGFFKRQSYFSVLKNIAQAGIAYAFVDTPTEDEIEEAILRGNDTCADILRILPVSEFISHVETAGVTVDEILQQRDIITKTMQTRREDLTNSITVPWQEYEIVDGKPKPKEDSDVQFYTVRREDSIENYGLSNYDFPQNSLIQTEVHASRVAGLILDAFSEAPRNAELQTFGDVTRKIGDVLDLPEYMKKGIVSRGNYSVVRIQTEYDGGIRQNIFCRRINTSKSEISIINELGFARNIFDESGDRDANVIEAGRGL